MTDAGLFYRCMSISGASCYALTCCRQEQNGPLYEALEPALQLSLSCAEKYGSPRQCGREQMMQEMRAEVQAEMYERIDSNAPKQNVETTTDDEGPNAAPIINNNEKWNKKYLNSEVHPAFFQRQTGVRVTFYQTADLKLLN